MEKSLNHLTQEQGIHRATQRERSVSHGVEWGSKVCQVKKRSGGGWVEA